MKRYLVLSVLFLLTNVSSQAQSFSRVNCDGYPSAQACADAISNNATTGISIPSQANHARRNLPQSNPYRGGTQVVDQWHDQPQARAPEERSRNFWDVISQGYDLYRCAEGESWSDRLNRAVSRCDDEVRDVAAAGRQVKLKYDFRAERGYTLKVCDALRASCYTGPQRVTYEVTRLANDRTDIYLEVEVYDLHGYVGWTVFEDTYAGTTQYRGRQSRGSKVIRVEVDNRSRIRTRH